MSRRFLAAAAVAWAVLLAAPAARGDAVRLQNGGELRGLLVGASRRPDAPLTMESLLGSRVVLDRGSVALVTRRSAKVEDYITRSRQVEDTIDARWKLAEWCRANRLLPQRDEQLEAIVLLDPDHAEARRGLDHVRHRGAWMTRDAAMEEQGYIKHKGKYITRQEFELAEKSAAQRAAEVEWFPKVRLWTGWVSGPHAGRRAEGLARLKGIDDPAAIPALEQHLGGSTEAAARALFVAILRGIPGDAPLRGLVQFSLLDSVSEIRTAAFEGLPPARYDDMTPLFVEALGHRENVVVRRAARALERIGDERTVPALIAALITRHRVEIAVPIDTYSVTNTPRGPTMTQPTSGLPPQIELMLRTGQLPHGVIMANPGAAPTRTVIARVDVSNDDVLSALKSITQQDFGFDQDAWQLYWAARANAPLRR